MQHIPNPHPTATCASRVQSNLDQTIFDYFFRHIYAGDRGSRQAIINTLFQALYDECKSAGIPAAYDPTGDSHARVLTILARVNFRPAPELRVDDQPPAPIRQRKPRTAKGHESGGAAKVRGKNTEPGT